MLLSLCPVGCLSFEKLNWDSQQGRDLAMSGSNKKKIQLSQSCSYIMWKVCNHLIWIQTYLGFIVLFSVIIQFFLVQFWSKKPKNWICFEFDFENSKIFALLYAGELLVFASVEYVFCLAFWTNSNSDSNL